MHQFSPQISLWDITRGIMTSLGTTKGHRELFRDLKRVIIGMTKGHQRDIHKEPNDLNQVTTKVIRVYVINQGPLHARSEPVATARDPQQPIRRADLPRGSPPQVPLSTR